MEQKQPSHRKRVKFSLTTEPGRRVFVAGTFNDWSTAKHALKPDKNNGRYVGEFMVPVGRHEYKFVVDGQWQVDPDNAHWVPNGIGSLNSVIEV